ncbi:MAG: Gfo/Idh/MocA family oxidoreductase [Planctomycetota bacterium]|nr:Gfo/Idh/MocA family oxidoreductase [Planctomycetota bacterium]
MSPIGLGIVGVGTIVRFAHLPALTFLDEFEMRGVVNSKPESTRAAAQRFRARGFASHQDLVRDPSIDAVLIATGPAQHETVIRAALDAGKHVFCETPAQVATPEASREIMAVAAGKRLVVQAGHCFRYSPLVDLLQEHLRDATGPRLWSFEYFPYIGHIHNLALHLSGPVERVVGSRAGPFGSTTTLEFKNGDAAVIVGRSLNNCALDIESIRVSTRDFFGEIAGRRTVRVARMPVGVPFHEWSTRNAPATTFEAQAGGRMTLEVSGYLPQLRAFAKSIRDGSPPRSTLADVQETAELASRIAAAQKA